MQLPFTINQFIGVFTTYNNAIGLLPLVAYALGALAVFSAVRGPRGSERLVPVTLAAMWGWTGVVYHLMHFSAINPAARLFGLAFVVQAVAFSIEAYRGRLRFGFSLRDARSRMGMVMVAFSMVVYPLVGMLSGHGYPNGPVFGLTPCPLVIFTFGMLLLSERTMPKYLVAIPLLWALVGSTAAFSLGIREDTGLLVSALLGTTMLVTRRTTAVAEIAKTHGKSAAPRVLRTLNSR
ncbi:MAG TPA: DUF6064 family protein [Coriobacteriia bacterium]|nr:DUF6064 family protein [Coriobacteriia bacterium]